jgi:uncharacterized protein YndB with AHSA1/START domain
VSRSFVATATSSLPVDQVWAVLADIAEWPTWGPPSRAERLREGATDPDGVGSQWRIGKGPFSDVYEIRVVDPPHHLAYGLVSGIPVRGHLANVELAPRPDVGTSISWSGSWERTPPPSVLWGWLMHTACKQIAKKLGTASAPGTPRTSK